MALAGQDPVIGEILGRVDVVLGQHDLALDGLGSARGAEAFLAGRERVEPGGARRLQDRLALGIGHLVRLALEMDRDLAGTTSPSSLGWIGIASLPEASNRSMRTLSCGMPCSNSVLSTSFMNGPGPQR